MYNVCLISSPMEDNINRKEVFDRENILIKIDTLLLQKEIKMRSDLRTGQVMVGFNPKTLKYIKNLNQYNLIVQQLRDLSLYLVVTLREMLKTSNEKFTNEELETMAEEEGISSIIMDFTSPQFERRKEINNTLQYSVFLQDNLYEIILENLDIKKANGNHLSLTALQWRYILDFSINNNVTFPDGDPTKFIRNFKSSLDYIGITQQKDIDEILKVLMLYIDDLITISKNSTYVLTLDTLNNCLFRFHSFFQTISLF